MTIQKWFGILPVFFGVLCAGATGASAAGVFMPAVIPQPASAGDVVGIVFRNDGATASAARVVSFGQAFEDGVLPAGSGLKINGAPAQLDPKNAWPDGSVKFGVVTATAPALAPGAGMPAMLGLAAPAAGAVGFRDVVPNLATLAITVHGPGGAQPTRTLDVGRLLAASAGSAWLAGPLASQTRIIVRLPRSLQAILDVTDAADHGVTVDLTLTNDLILTPGAGEVDYDATLTVGGHSVAYKNLKHFAYQAIHLSLASNGANTVSVLHDIASLERTALIPAYDLTPGVNQQTVGLDVAHFPQYCVPLNTCGIIKYQPRVGGRPDIGPQPRWVSIALLTQLPSALTYLYQQADAAAAITWHFSAGGDAPIMPTDPINGTGQLFLTAAGEPAADAPAVAPLVSDRATGIVPSIAHQPDASYVPYLLTGRRAYLDDLLMQAAYGLDSIKPGEPSAPGGPAFRSAAAPYLGMGLFQVRGSAWFLRQLLDAAAATPDLNPLHAVFAAAVDENLTAVPALTAPAIAMVPGFLFEKGAQNIQPWEGDYVTLEVARAAQFGYVRAGPALAALAPWELGRFQQNPTVFDPYNGPDYALVLGTLPFSFANLQAASLANPGGALACTIVICAAQPWKHAGIGYQESAGAAVLAGWGPGTGAAAFLLNHWDVSPADASGDGSFQTDPTWSIMAAPPH